MANHLIKIFRDRNLIGRIKKRLPYLFQLAELESSRAGKIGMEVGSAREKILIALLIYKFGEKNVGTNIPITETETDVKLFGESISIKTITTNTLQGIKLIWTVDATKAKEFHSYYSPSADILLAQINWEDKGYLFYIPLEVQKEVFELIGNSNYIKLPKAGTNPRGVEITKEALRELIEHDKTKSIEIEWRKKKISFNVYQKWIDFWKENKNWQISRSGSK